MKTGANEMAQLRDALFVERWRARMIDVAERIHRGEAVTDPERQSLIRAIRSAPPPKSEQGGPTYKNLVADYMLKYLSPTTSARSRSISVERELRECDRCRSNKKTSRFAESQRGIELDEILNAFKLTKKQGRPGATVPSYHTLWLISARMHELASRRTGEEAHSNISGLPARNRASIRQWILRFVRRKRDEIGIAWNLCVADIAANCQLASSQVLEDEIAHMLARGILVRLQSRLGLSWAIRSEMKIDSTDDASIALWWITREVSLGGLYEIRINSLARRCHKTPKDIIRTLEESGPQRGHLLVTGRGGRRWLWQYFVGNLGASYRDHVRPLNIEACCGVPTAALIDHANDIMLGSLTNWGLDDVLKAKLEEIHARESAKGAELLTLRVLTYFYAALDAMQPTNIIDEFRGVLDGILVAASAANAGLAGQAHTADSG